jgi:hypothetical protein
MLLKNDIIKILPQFQDTGDDSFTWVCISNEDKGRVDISPINTGLNLAPIYTVTINMIERV